MLDPQRHRLDRNHSSRWDNWRLPFQIHDQITQPTKTTTMMRHDSQSTRRWCSSPVDRSYAVSMFGSSATRGVCMRSWRSKNVKAQRGLRLTFSRPFAGFARFGCFCFLSCSSSCSSFCLLCWFGLCWAVWMEEMLRWATSTQDGAQSSVERSSVQSPKNIGCIWKEGNFASALEDFDLKKKKTKKSRAIPGRDPFFF